MEKRPIFAFSVAIFAGIFSAGLKPSYMNYAALVIAPVFCIFYCAMRLRQMRIGRMLQWRKNKRYVIELIIISALTAVLPAIAYNDCVNVWKRRIMEYSEYDGREVEAVLKLISKTERSGDWSRVMAEPLAINGKAVDSSLFRPAGKINFYYGNQDGYNGTAEDDENDIENKCINFLYDTVVIVRGRLSKPAPQQNEYLFNYQTYLFSKGIAASIYGEPGFLEIVSEPFMVLGIPAHPIGAGIAVRERIADIFFAALPAGQASLIIAILLGGTENLDDKSYNDFAASGLLHLMAVSGMHIMIIANLAAAAISRARFGVRMGRAMSLGLILLFAFVAGFSPSIVRATLVFCLSTISKYMGRAFDQLSAVGLAAIVLLLGNPMQAFGAGFILSFASAISIYCLSRNIKINQKGAKIPRVIIESIKITMAVSIGCYPIQSTLFHSYSTVSILSNLLCAPLVTGVLGIGLATAVIGLISIPLSKIPALFVVNFLWAIEQVASLTAHIPNAIIKPGAFGAPAFLTYYSIVAIIIVLLNNHLRSPQPNVDKNALSIATASRPPLDIGINLETPEGDPHAAAAKRRVLIAVMAFIACISFFVGLFNYNNAIIRPDEMEVVFLDVGNSNAAYVNIGGRIHIIIDAGGKAGYQYNDIDDESMFFDESRLSEYLFGRGVGTIDIAIATHGDLDHIQGFWTILENMPVHRLLLPIYVDDNLNKLAAFAQSQGTQILKCATGDKISLGTSASIEIISPISDSAAGSAYISATPLNDLSIVAKVAFGDMNALFCGDIGAAAETCILENAARDALASQLISVPHHGSKYSSGESFLAKVSPQIAVAGVGRNNYGHPAIETIERYEAAGAVFLRTDRDGMVSILCDLSGIKSIWRYNDPANRPAWQNY